MTWEAKYIGKVICGDCLELMADMPDECVHCVVTSPPYYSLRDYGIEGQFGLEETIEEYLDNMVAVFREVKRVLRDDGTVWLNIGDSYAGGGRGFGYGGKQDTNKGCDGMPESHVPDGLKPKDLCMIPARLALALQADGWWVRSQIVWSKPNPMPESVNGWRWEQHQIKVKPQKIIENGRYETELKQCGNKRADINPDWLAEWADCPGCPKCNPNDGLILRKGSWRPTKSYELVYMLAKSECYFGDGEAVRERSITDPNSKASMMFGAKDGKMNTVEKAHAVDVGHKWEFSETRNLRDVWEIATQPYKEAHFATFPEKLVEPCIKAGTSEKGCCAKCGMVVVRVVEKAQGGSIGKSWHNHDLDEVKGNMKVESSEGYMNSKTAGWRPACSCNSETVPCVVLDPFMGSGTVGVVAHRLGRDFIGIELSPEYVAMAEKRLEPLLNQKRLAL